MEAAACQSIFLKAADKILDIIIVLSLQNWKTGCTVN